MLGRIVDWSLDNRPLVLILAALIVAGGAYSLTQLPIDAVPDVTNVQVQVLTKAPALGPVEMEQFITYPVEAAMNGLPKLVEIRSISRYGLSAVTVVFEDDVDVYFARQLVAERLTQAREAIPPGLGNPEMGPVSTGLGEVFMFTVEGEGLSPMERRTILDWDIAPRMRAIPGVTEVNVWGGLPKQYQVVIDPAKLVSYGLSLKEVFEAVERGTGNAGGGYIERNREQYIIRGEGLIRNLDDIRKLVLKTGSEGTPVMVGQIAEVREGSMLRIGAATRDGEGETVIGLAQMLAGENALAVASRVRKAVEELQPTLPKGARIVPFYDREELVRRVIRTVETNLMEGGILVVAVLFAFLGNFRAGLIVASIIPLSMLLAFAGMVESRIAANLMSLGAIDFGLVVDGAVVVIENVVRRMSEPEGRQKTLRQLTAEGTHEVVRPITFGKWIIILVYLPLLTLGGIEGKMFKPMAFTVVFALVGSLLLTLTLIPVLASLFLKAGGEQHEPRFVGKLRSVYLRGLDGCFARRGLVIGVALVLLGFATIVARRLGGEFIPRLDEGDIVVQNMKLASVALSEATATTSRIERVLKRFPEVKTVVTRSGSPEVATDVMGIELADSYAILRPRSEWTVSSKGELVEKMEEALEGAVPGVGFLLHAAHRDALQRADRGRAVRRRRQALRRRPGRAGPHRAGDRPRDLWSAWRGRREARADDRLAGLARPGGPGPLRALRHLGRGRARHRRGRPGGQGGRHGLRRATPLRPRRPLRRRYGARCRRPGQHPRGHPRGREHPPPAALRHSAGHRALADQPGGRPAADRGGDERARSGCGHFRQGCRRADPQGGPAPQWLLPRWGGQFENLQAASRRLAIVVPLALALIFAMLYFTFGAPGPAVLIYLNVPFAAVGGVFALALRGMPFSISAGVGFIALFGVAVLNGVVLMSQVREIENDTDLPVVDVLRRACGHRMRPVLMTALVASLGFMPMALAMGSGAEVQRPLATVVIGGLVTCTLLTLFVLPSIYSLLRRQVRQPSAGSSA